MSMSNAGHSRDTECHRFAWDGFSFEVPDDWHLAQYHFGTAEASAEMQDDDAARLQIEWLWPKGRVSAERLKKRYLGASTELDKVAEDTAALPDLPADWTGFVYTMPSKRRLVAAYWLAPERDFVVMLRLHFDRGGPQRPARVLGRLAETFTLHRGDRIPWEFYDVSFELGRRFRLVATQLEAGRKLMVFQWRLRKLYLWQFSLADMVLKGREPAEWAAAFVNDYKPIRGPVFAARPGGRIVATRGGAYRFGYYDEVGRMCFRYRAVCRHVRESNTIRLMVFNYRGEYDLRELERALDPEWVGRAA
ncbi:MAG: hypothetical protein HQ559_09845 [Lentisphaerae bacterium]|nr:hypothetical protein [Lentisphaerota bacterium]